MSPFGNIGARVLSLWLDTSLGLNWPKWTIPEKNQKLGDESWGYGISWGIKEITCRISRGYLKMEWSFQGWSFVLSGISRAKVKKWKIPGVFQKSMSSPSHPPPSPTYLFFFWNSPIKFPGPTAQVQEIFEIS